MEKDREVAAIALLTISLLTSGGVMPIHAAIHPTVRLSAHVEATPPHHLTTPPPIRPRSTCPTELEPLTRALTRDLPGYINRLSHQRGGSLSSRYAIATSQASLAPLPVVASNLDPKSGGLYQVFFTVLERQYATHDKTEAQNHLWLFLAHTEQTDWQLAIVYSRLGAYPTNGQVATPLHDATREVTGRAIRLWLRDCNAGAVQIP